MDSDSVLLHGHGDTLHRMRRARVINNTGNVVT